MGRQRRTAALVAMVVGACLALASTGWASLPDVPVTLPPSGATAAALSELSGYIDSGVLNVDVVVTHAGSIDTYTYTVTNVSSWMGVCRFVVSGFGNLTSAGTSSPAGWAATTQTKLNAAAWWVWNASAGSELAVGSSVVFSLSVNGPTTAVQVPGSATVLCPKGVKELELTGPSACSALVPGDPETPTSMQGCMCDGTCSTTKAFEGEGTRISLYGSPTVHVAACTPIWVRHGLIASATLDPSTDFDLTKNWFRLYVDDVLVSPLDYYTIVAPDGTPGTLYVDREWYAQFPAGYFAPLTTHTIRGEWYSADWDTGVLVRQITLVTDLSCASAPTPVAKMPDLTVEVSSASCGYSGNDFLLTVTAAVHNVGDGDAEAFTVSLGAEGFGSTEARIASLDAGATTTRTLTLRLPPGQVQCPLVYVLTADTSGAVDESDEQNNAQAGSICCQ